MKIEVVDMIAFYSMIDNEMNLSKFRRIYELYKNMMYLVAYDICKNSHDAEDVVENSLIKVIGVLDEIQDEEIARPRCKNLMITITKNTAIDFMRKDGRMPMPCMDVDECQTEKSAEDLYIEMENYEELIACIDELDENYRDVLRLRILHHLNAKETGDILNISEYNVNTRLMRARKLLADKLREHGEHENGFRQEQ